METQLIKISNLKNNTGQINGLPKNPRILKDDKFEKLKQSLIDDPEMLELREVIAYDNNGELVVICGNMRLKALKELGIKEVPTKILPFDTAVEKLKAYTIKDNVGFGEHDWEMLKTEWDIDELSEWGMDIPVFEIEPEAVEKKEQNKKLSDRFIIPPFSVLDTKQGAWQDRKRYWLSLGIKSELGRENVLSGDVNGTYNNTKESYNIFNTFDVSIFDPVLCELAYKWFNTTNGKILDCFAGGSVRGIVAAKLGYEYLGNDLRSEQIEANRTNAKEVLQDSEVYPTWTCGDSLHIDKIAKGYEADLLFSCPPYADLEVYSDAKEDISNMPYKEFMSTYREIIRKSCALLKNDRFAVFVVSEVREKQEFYYGFISDTVHAFKDSGCQFYNDIVLYNMIGRTAMTCVKGMRKRKVGKVHQNVLVFYKGNPKNIKANYPELDLSYMQDEETIEE